MAVTEQMVRELINWIRRDHPCSNKNMQRESPKDEANTRANKISEQLRKKRYSGEYFHQLVENCNQLYKNFAEQNKISENSWSEQAWLIKYLPVFSSDILTRMINRHQSKHNYSELSEICVQSLTALMLAYHSDFQLFNENIEQFEILANTWLEVLFTCTFTAMPYLMDIIDNWDDFPVYSTPRNLIFLKYITMRYLEGSRSLTGIRVITFSLASQPDVKERNVYEDYAIAFAALLNTVTEIIDDFDKLTSHQFYQAVDQFRSINNVTSSQQQTSAPQLQLSETEQERRIKESIKVMIKLRRANPEKETKLNLTSEQNALSAHETTPISKQQDGKKGQENQQIETIDILVHSFSTLHYPLNPEEECEQDKLAYDSCFIF